MFKRKKKTEMMEVPISEVLHKEVMLKEIKKQILESNKDILNFKKLNEDKDKIIEGQFKEIRRISREHKKKISEAIQSRNTDEDYFKIPEKARWYNPISWYKSDKTNPLVMVIMTPAGDLTIRERVADQRGNLSLGKKTMYRTEAKEIWDIAESDVTGFRGKKVLFYFQDVPDPISIRRDDEKMVVNTNTENYSKSQKTHLVSELLSEELSFRDYLTMVLIGVNVVMSLVILYNLFFMNK